MRKFASLLILSLGGVLGLASCTSTPTSSSISSSEEVSPVGQLQEIFYRLRNNNFSLAYNDRYASNNTVRYQDTYYTEYSLESDGDFGFNGYAQGDGYIFAYNIVDDEIVSGVPIVNSSTGMRYENIYDLRDGLQDFDYTALPTSPDSDGWYTYTFGENTSNDRAIETVFLRMTYNPAFVPRSLRMQVSGVDLQIEAVLLEYEVQQDRDTASCRVYNIGNTNNQIIKDYLEDGGTSKEPLDTEFFRLITPYLERNNFKTHLDATEYTTTAAYSTFQMDQYFSDDAVVYERLDVDEGVYGQIQTPYGVAHFAMDEIDSNKLEITSTAYNEDLEFYDNLYGDYLTDLFTTLAYSSFIGYKDDVEEDCYYLTDSYLQYVLSYICYFQTDTNENAIESLQLYVDSYEEHAFTLHFNMINRSTNVRLGTYKVSFSNPGEIEFEAVKRYLNDGEDPASQEEGTLEAVLEEFRKNNYSMDILTGSGLAKTYYTEDYFYVEVYGSPSSNYGYLKQDGAIYYFNLLYNAAGLNTGISVNTTTDYSSYMSLPGVGSYQGASDDLFYFSTFSDLLYDYDSYVVDEIRGISYYRNTNAGFATSVFKYFYPNEDSVLPYSTGFRVSNGEDTYDKRVTLISSFVYLDGTQYGVISATYYDIGGTSHPYIESYLEGGSL